MLIVTAQNANAAFIDLVAEAADVTNVVGTKIFIYQDLPDSDSSKAPLTDFATRFTAKTGRSATLVSNIGWDMMLSLTEAIKTAGTDREKIRDALETQKGLQTLTVRSIGARRTTTAWKRTGSLWVSMPRTKSSS